MIIDFGNDNKGGSGKLPVINPIEITANGVYKAPQGVDGYSPVTVKVPTSGGPIRLADHPGMRLGYSTFFNLKDSEYDFSGLQDGRLLFAYCTNLETVPSSADFSSILSADDMFCACGSLKTLPAGLDFSNLTSAAQMFDSCSNLQTLPSGLDFQKVTSAEQMFNACWALSGFPDGISFPSLTNARYMFAYCENLADIPASIGAAFGKVTYGYGLFYGCVSLKSLPEMDFSSLIDTCEIFGIDEMSKLTELGGFKNLKADWNDEYGLAKCPNLTKQSVLNVLNGLYDFRGNGDMETTRTIKFHPNSIALLTDEDRLIATNKGWVLA